MKHKSYHTAIKTCYALEIQEILPNELKEDIPRSTSHYWKNEHKDKYVGHEFAEKIAKNLDQAGIILNDKVKFERQLFVTFCRIKITLLNILGKASFQKSIKSNKADLIGMVERTKDILGTKNLCKFLDVNVKTYSSWKSHALFKCPNSAFNLCFRKVPTQISKLEIDSLKDFMTNPKFFNWPIASIWAYAFRTGKVVMSISTWYRYTQKLELNRERLIAKYKPKRTPLRASKPNEIWHADVSIFKTSDNVKFYIYTVVDNCSRMILSWDISREISGKTRLKSIKRAIEEQFKVKLNQSVDLIVDGGSENNNSVIHDFIQKNQVDITKKVALKDIIQSNSIVEATYKIMKHKYFYMKEIHSNHLNHEMEEFVYDYNEVRPHYSLGLYTPSEIHNKNTHSFNKETIIKQAIKERIVSNQFASCSVSCH